MAGKQLAAGVAGDIWTQRITDEGVKPERWKAGCRYRHTNGTIQQLVRRGTSEKDAKTNLRTCIRDLQGDVSVTLTGASRFREAAAIYLERIKTKRKGTTYDQLRNALNNRILPALGELRLRECTAARLNDYIESLEKVTTYKGTPLSPGTRRGLRGIISGVMRVAVLHGVFSHNPVREIENIEGGTLRKPTAYDVEKVAEFFAKVDADKTAVKHGLHLFLRFLFLSGARIGEATALRWRDVNLSDKPVKVVDPVAGEKVLPPHSLWINGNIVRVTGQGLLRHAGKTFRSQRLIAPMPPSLYDMLFMMKPAGDVDPDRPVFANGLLSWVDPANTGTRIRALRERIGFPDFVSHIGRKTVGTRMDATGFTARQIADYLGKASVRDTQDTYMGRDLPNPAAAEAIDTMFSQPTD